MAIVDQINKLTAQLFPTGRAWKFPYDGLFKKLNKGLAVSEARAYEDGLSILDSAIPDNDDFTEDDATAWETRLGLITNIAVSLEDRKLAIQRKMNHPGTVQARENYRYVEASLQAAGFDVYVYENRFDDGMGGWMTMTPDEFSYDPFPNEAVQHGDRQHGDFQHGGSPGNKIVNSILSDRDATFGIGDNYRSTFFIGGSPQGSWAEVDAERELEFRQLVLKLKPVQTVAFTLIEFV